MKVTVYDRPCLACGRLQCTHSCPYKQRSQSAPRCRTCNHERVDGPRCDYCGTLAVIR